MDTSEILAKLIACGTPPDLLVEVTRKLAQLESDNERRARDAERKRLRRSEVAQPKPQPCPRTSADVQDSPGTSQKTYKNQQHDNSANQLRASTKRKGSVPPKEKLPPSETTKVVSSVGMRATAAIRALPAQPDNAALLHDAIESALIETGLQVYREHRVDLGNNQFGYIDLVVSDGSEWAAIEIDKRTPRGKSIRKLRRFDGYRIVVTRTAAPIGEFQGLVDAVECVAPIARQSPSPSMRKSQLPENFALNETDYNACCKVGWSTEKIESELARFRDHAAMNARLCVDWHAAFRNWVRSPYQTVNGARHGEQRETLRQQCDRLAAQLDAKMRGATDAGGGNPRRSPHDDGIPGGADGLFGRIFDDTRGNVVPMAARGGDAGVLPGSWDSPGVEIIPPNRRTGG